MKIFDQLFRRGQVGQQVSELRMPSRSCPGGINDFLTAGAKYLIIIIFKNESQR